ncbi:MAG: cyclase family protein [Actinomycetota bacterium]
MTRVIDVSLPIGPDLLVWPGDPPVELTPRLQLSKGDPANVSELRLGTHTGTHVDPPLHFIDGAAAIDEVPLDALYGEAVVADARGMRGQLGPAELEALAIPDGVKRLLLKSDNSEMWRSFPAKFPDEYVCLSPEGARWVVERGIRLIGVDFLSVEMKGAPEHPTHVELLKNGVVIVEGLNLGDVEPGGYLFGAFPLRIAGGDGGPARAVLFH